MFIERSQKHFCVIVSLEIYVYSNDIKYSYIIQKLFTVIWNQVNNHNSNKMP